jgi:VWFA-related protein
MKNTLCILFVLFCVAGFLFAADGAKPEQVIITISAEDKSHHAVTDLQPKDFSVTDNNAPVAPISAVYAGSEPKDWILAIDSSGSMRRTPMWRPAIEAAVKQLSPLMRQRGDRVAVVTVQDNAYIDQQFTSNESEIRSTVDNIDPRGGTALYDAVTASADYLVRKRQPGRQQVLWVITDGWDNASTHSLEQATDYVSGSGVPVLFSLIGDESRGMKAMQHLAKYSGGSVFRLKGKNECDQQTQKLVDFADHEYVIAFSPATDARSHRIRVTTSRAGVELMDADRSVVRSNTAN